MLKREEQVRGMREWDVRGSLEACEGVQGAEVVAEACIRAYNRDDGRGVMGFFVAGFVRDGDVDLAEGEGVKDDGPFVRDANGIIVRDENGIPTLKSTGKKAVGVEDGGSEEVYVGEGGGAEGPFVRDGEGRIVRDAAGMPTLKEGSVMLSAKEKAKREKESKRKAKNKKNKKGKKVEVGEAASEDEGGDDGEWGGFE